MNFSEHLRLLLRNQVCSRVSGHFNWKLLQSTTNTIVFQCSQNRTNVLDHLHDSASDRHVHISPFLLFKVAPLLWYYGSHLHCGFRPCLISRYCHKMTLVLLRNEHICGWRLRRNCLCVVIIIRHYTGLFLPYYLFVYTSFPPFSVVFGVHYEV